MLPSGVADLSAFNGTAMDSAALPASPAAAPAPCAPALHELASAWRRLALDPAAGHGSELIAETVGPALEALMRFGAQSIDLRGLSPERVNGVHLSALLRATSRNRAQVPGWDEALRAARAALRRDGLDASKILAGLR